MASRAFTAARGELKISDGAGGTVIVAYCTGVNGNEVIARRPIRPIGTVEAVERPAVAVDVSFSASFVRMVDKDEIQQKIIGGRSTEDLLNEGEGILELYDAVTDKPIYQILGAVPTSVSFSVMSGDVVTFGATFEGRKLIRESEIA